MLRASVNTWIIVAIPVVGVLAIVVGLKSATTHGRSAASQPVAMAVSYDYATQPDSTDLVRTSAAQWPQNPRSQMTAMTSRLDEVVRRINLAAGTHCIVRLGETGHAAVANGDNTVTVDTSVLWRLSEDGLAALIAHEFGHEALGHGLSLERLNKDREQGVPNLAARERDLELAADEFAGATVAKAGFKPDGMAEILNRVNCPDWESPLVRQYVSREQREAMFRRAFDQAGAASQPSH